MLISLCSLCPLWQKLFRGSSQAFTTENTEGHRENRSAGASDADFSARHVWLGELGRTQGPRGIFCPGGALNGLRSKARRTGVRGETYAYWYLRRNGYVMIARNFTYRGMKGEIDLVGYDGATSPSSK